MTVAYEFKGSLFVCFFVLNYMYPALVSTTVGIFSLELLTFMC